MTELFATLDWLEERLARQRYLMGDRITEADWRLFTTLLRFDPVYHGHFKCNLRRLVDYPNLWAYTRELYQWPGVAETVDFAHIKGHYYASHAHHQPDRHRAHGPAPRLRRSPRPRARCRRPPRVAWLLLPLAACEPESDRPALSSLPAAATLDSSLLVGYLALPRPQPLSRPGEPGDHHHLRRRRGLCQRVRDPRARPAGRRSGDPARPLVDRRGAPADPDVITQARALDGDTETDALAKASAELVDAMSRGKPAASEVLRLDARRLTLRPADVTDPPVIGCARRCSPADWRADRSGPRAPRAC